MMFHRALALCLALAACDDHPRSTEVPKAVWEIGPIIDGRNYSLNPPPIVPESAGFSIDLPQPAAGHVHYVTFRHGPLTGKTRIVMRYRVEMADGVSIVPQTAPELPSILSLYFQRAGDSWSGRGNYEAYRWYSSFAAHSPIVAGEHELAVRLDENWTAVQYSSAASNPVAFREAIDHADRVGFVLGGGDGLGHGVYATGPARLVVTSFKVE